jgi:hypothetical protein
MEGEIVNRVQKSGLRTIDLEEMYIPGDRAELDIADQLFQGLILREKDFREFVKEHDWNQYEGKYVAVHCSADAVVPTWAYMLVASKLSGVAKYFVHGTLVDLERELIVSQIQELNTQEFEGAKLVIKGCGELPIPESVYTSLMQKLTPVVSSIMYGEPCSTVPVYKARKKVNS